jgi:hypothetical protein
VVIETSPFLIGEESLLPSQEFQPILVIRHQLSLGFLNAAGRVVIAGESLQLSL